jgi:hydrogenase maturation protein HypF
MKCWHIHIEGQVQGVGFRPFVYQEAKSQNLNGWVNNGVDGVHIKINATPLVAKRFYKQILNKAPALSRILKHNFEEVEFEEFKDFEIVESMEEGLPNLLITPDFGICNECEKELLKKENRRYHYPFITCTKCGPRYSIIGDLPYDRHRTTMDSFKMCPSCEKEYNNPLERRHFSQTNSCEECGINLSLENKLGNVESGDPDIIIERLCDLIKSGQIIGIKGIGGYLLIADACNEETIKLLRERKKRPSKPFALMYPDVQEIKEDAHISREEEKLITSVQSPIVLVKLKSHSKSGIIVNVIAPKLQEIGVMRPYAPLFALMMNKLGKPVIATSGNISGSPVVFKDKTAREQLFDICDYLLVNDRQIVIPQDDSVLKVLEDKNHLVLRRSRGYAPSLVHSSFRNPVPDLISMGAMLKSTFALTHSGNTYISQYIGDLESFDTQQSYNHTIKHFIRLFRPEPEKVLIDLHPNYYSTSRGIELTKELGVPLKKVQHHEAHFMAVLAENDLLFSEEKILGVIWDGTGLGSDGQIWGGEYFKYEQNEIERVDHIPYFDHILGDKFAKEPRLAALSLCHIYCLNAHSLESKFSQKEWNFYNKLLSNSSNLQTSSMGRIFDGVSNILGISNFNSFEGEAAMHLQAKAEKFATKNGIIRNTFLSLDGDLGQCIQELMIGANAGVSKGKLAYDFHNWLVNQIKNQAGNLAIEKIAFSGGVFQNSFLLLLLKKYMGHEYELYFHKQLSPNDEGISFGQLIHEYTSVKTKIKPLEAITTI